MMLSSTTAAIVLFAIGIWLLISLALTFEQARKLHHMVENTRNELFNLLDRRAERLPVLLREGGVLSALVTPLADVSITFHRYRDAQTMQERVQAEQEINTTLFTLFKRAETLGIIEQHRGKIFTDLLIEMQEQEPFLAASCERFNEAASAWNQYRSSFPANLLADAQGWETMYLFTRSESS